MNKGNYHNSYHQSALRLISEFDFSQPFSLYLKYRFKREKKFGSRDRKIIADLCYGYFRIGESAHTHDHELQVIIGFYLTHQQDNGYLECLKSEWISSLGEPLSFKFQFLKEIIPDFNPLNIFPFITECTQSVQTEELTGRMLSQPEVHLRVRPGKEETVKRKIRDASLKNILLSETAIAIRGNPDLDSILQIDHDCVVQDISSQLTLLPLSGIQTEIKSIWDACAGSGGKSIHAHDLFPTARIYASDIRENILDELKRRFNLASIRNAKLFCNDLEHPMSASVVRSNLPQGGVDLIIADVPCTGSGTWSRSPEWLRAFDKESIQDYQDRQKRIIQNVIPHLKLSGGYFLYITCSVYQAENEEMVSFILTHSHLKLLKSENISGINGFGDFLFVALFTS